MIFSLSNLLTTLQTYPTTSRFWIAYSGGLDSHVLLYALAQLRSALPHIELQAIHIHHGLQKNADAWAAHCQTICQQLAISCDVIHVNIEKKHRQSLEAQAREVRYQAIKNKIADNDIVLTGQHADDQAETVLLQLLRGSGVAGLAAMPTIIPFGQGWLARPLLSYPRQTLENYATNMHLNWIQDESNFDTCFDRNFLRHEIIPLLQTRWSNLNQTLGRVAQHQAETQTLLHTLAQLDLKTCLIEENQSLAIYELQHLSVARQRNLLKMWIKQCSLPQPSSQQLQQILTTILPARQDAQPIVKWQGGEARRFQNQLFIMKNLPDLPQLQSLSWNRKNAILLPLGQLQFIQTETKGLALSDNQKVTVQFRQGGEVCTVFGKQHRVKKLLQDKKIPPWLRGFIPLIYVDNELAAIPNVAICDPFFTHHQGWQVEWHKLIFDI